MDRENEYRADDLIDLGSVAEETKGPIAPLGDTVGLSFGAGLSED